MRKSVGERITNAIIGGLGIPLCIVFMIILIVKSSSIINIVFSILFSASLFVFSVFYILYNALDKNIFKKFSYIFFVISLTLLLITICLNNIGIISWIIFGFSIFFLIINIIFSLFKINWFKYITLLCNCCLLGLFILTNYLFIHSNMLFSFFIINFVLVILLYYFYTYKVSIHYLLTISILSLISFSYLLLI